MFAPFQRGKDVWQEPEQRRPRVASDAQASPNERTWLLLSLRPQAHKVDDLLDSFVGRWAALVLFPCAIIWVWVAIPFPLHSKPAAPAPSDPLDTPAVELDVDFYFFLLWFFGLYLAAALLFVTSLFGLYVLCGLLGRWPLGGVGLAPLGFARRASAVEGQAAGWRIGSCRHRLGAQDGVDRRSGVHHGHASL
jgi:hypothetical protein